MINPQLTKAMTANQFFCDRFSEAEIKEWYQALPFEQGVAVNSICWTVFPDHQTLLNQVKQYNWPMIDKIKTLCAYHQSLRRNAGSGVAV